jgi:hypothetical protein
MRLGLRLPALVLVQLLCAARAHAAAPTKEECVDAHGRGQDQREAGHLSLARDSFAVCSQPACPALVQSDCAQFSEELARLSPSVTFAARDQHDDDLPETEVYVDGALIAHRLDEGRTYDIDPGKHAVRFVDGNRSVLLNVVVSEGEHGRNLIAKFVDPSEPPQPAATSSAIRYTASPVADREPRRAVFPLVVAVAGGAALTTGAVLMGLGLGKVPRNCSLGSHECIAAPGDAAFQNAHDGVALATTGLAVAITGAVIGIGGLVWYFAETPKFERRGDAALKPVGTFSF